MDYISQDPKEAELTPSFSDEETEGIKQLKAISTESGGTGIWGQLASLLYLQRQPSGM